MPLPSDYDTPAGEGDAEIAIRQALADCFLVVGASYGFTTDLIHTRPRYPETDALFEMICTISDPDTAAAIAASKMRLVRYFSVKLTGFKRTLLQLTLRYQIIISFGFKDTYLAAPMAGQNSHDQQAACTVRYQKYLADNLNLGLDDRATHDYLEMLYVEFIPVDKQGGAANAMIGKINVFLNVC